MEFYGNPWTLRGSCQWGTSKTSVCFKVLSECTLTLNSIETSPGADPGFFLGRGALVSCSTSTPINHIVFFLQNTSCIRKPQVISEGEGSVHPLHPPPRSAPALATPFHLDLISSHIWKIECHRKALHEPYCWYGWYC